MHSRAFWIVGIFLIVQMAVFLALVSVRISQNNSLIHEGAQARKAICSLRHDLVQRIETGKNFLQSHPNGVPGIPSSVIQNGIKNEQQTITAFNQSGLHC